MNSAPQDFNWTSLDDNHLGILAAEYRTFFGHQVSVSIGRIDESLSPDPESLALLMRILGSFDSILDRAEAALSEYADAVEDSFESHLSDPIISITPGSRNWTLVVERDDWPDFGWHIEFDELNFVEVWSGD